MAEDALRAAERGARGRRVGVDGDDLVERAQQERVVAVRSMRLEGQRRGRFVLRRDELRPDIGRDDDRGRDQDDQQLPPPEHPQEIVERQSALPSAVSGSRTSFGGTEQYPSNGGATPSVTPGGTAARRRRAESRRQPRRGSAS